MTLVYITGDTHGRLERIDRFSKVMGTSKRDTMIILGDVGLNYYGDRSDSLRKRMVQQLPLRVFCIHGNHENRPQNIESYAEGIFCGGKVLYEEAFPDILFAIDGEVYNFDGMSCIVIGGAYSVDKHYRLLKGYGWWEDEQPSDEIKNRVEAKIEALDHRIDVVLSHTCPLKYEPTEVFLSFVDQSTVDKSTEKWLDQIETSLDYKKWYCGHYHTRKKIDRMQFMFEDIDVLSIRTPR